MAHDPGLEMDGSFDPTADEAVDVLDVAEAEDTAFDSTPPWGNRYVDIDSTAASPDGMSWATAFRDIQSGIDSAYEGCEVWVAEGRYFIYQSGHEDTLMLKPGVSVFGGFSGTEDFRQERNWDENLTIIDGHDAEGSGNRVRHVVTIRDNNVIDGFVITGGYADGEYFHGGGAGIFSEEASYDLANCVLVDNEAVGVGGALFGTCGIHHCGPQITSCIFSGNTALDGAGLALSYSNGPVQRSIFAGNLATRHGGAMRILWSWLAVESSVIAGNVAADLGGGIYCVGENELWVRNDTFSGNSAETGAGFYNETNSLAEIKNCILWGDLDFEIGFGTQPTVTTSDIRDTGYDGTGGNIWADPLYRKFPAESEDGTWTSVTYDDASVQTLLAATGVSWEAGAMKRLFVQPDISDARWFVIAQNSENELRVWGNVTDLAHPGDAFRIYDLALGPGSPCIDAASGDDFPGTDLEGNPAIDDPETPDTGSGTFSYADMGAYEYQP